jgi:sugar/nucleoside kinase (ribokinase family)
MTPDDALPDGCRRHLPRPPVPRRLIGVASILVDLTVDVPRLPPRGGDVLGTAAGSAPGGGINALGAAARLGLPTLYAGPHGTGPMGDAVRAALAADGVAALLPPDPRGDTGYCLALVEPGGERTFVTVAGIESHQRATDLDRVRPEPDDVVYVSGYDLVYPGSGPVLATWLSGLTPRADGGPYVVLDPGPLAGEIPTDRLTRALARTDLLTVSADELDPLGGTAALLPRLAPAAVVVVRDGARGARLVTTTADPVGLVVPAATPPGPVIDTNGAGDVHLGALIASVAGGSAWPRALAAAARAAAWSLTRRGANSGPTPATPGWGTH